MYGRIPLIVVLTSFSIYVGTPANFECNDAKQNKINEFKKCDGEKDCPNGADELGCPCNVLAFHCPTEEKCIPGRFACNGFNDCASERDEDIVPGLTNSCEEEHFPLTGSDGVTTLECPEHKKVRYQSIGKTCNGLLQCQDTAIDESDCGAICALNDINIAEEDSKGKPMQLFYCQGLCKDKNTDYCAVHKDKCYCLTSEQYTQLTEVEMSQCNFPCEGNGYGSCGGENRVIATTTVNSIINFDVPTDFEQAFALKNHQLNFVLADSSQCKKDESKESNPDYMEYMFAVRIKVNDSDYIYSKQISSFCSNESCIATADLRFPSEGAYLIEAKLQTAYSLIHYNFDRQIVEFPVHSVKEIICHNVQKVMERLSCSITIIGGRGFSGKLNLLQDQNSIPAAPVEIPDLTVELGRCEFNGKSTTTKVNMLADDYFVIPSSLNEGASSLQLACFEISTEPLSHESITTLPTSSLLVAIVKPECRNGYTLCQETMKCSSFSENCASDGESEDVEYGIVSEIARKVFVINNTPQTLECNVYCVEDSANEIMLNPGEMIAVRVIKSEETVVHGIKSISNSDNSVIKVSRSNSNSSKLLFIQNIADIDLQFKAIGFKQHRLALTTNDVLQEPGSIDVSFTLSHQSLPDYSLSREAITEVYLSPKLLSVDLQDSVILEDGSFKIGPVTEELIVRVQSSTPQFDWTFGSETQIGPMSPLSDNEFVSRAVLNFKSALTEGSSTGEVSVKVNISNKAGYIEKSFRILIDSCHLPSVTCSLPGDVIARRSETIELEPSLSQTCSSFKKNCEWSVTDILEEHTLGLSIDDFKHINIDDLKQTELVIPPQILNYTRYNVKASCDISYQETETISCKPAVNIEIQPSLCVTKIGKESEDLITEDIPITALSSISIKSTQSFQPDTGTHCNDCRFFCTKEPLQEAFLKTISTNHELSLNMESIDASRRCFDSIEMQSTECVLDSAPLATSFQIDTSFTIIACTIDHGVSCIQKKYTVVSAGTPVVKVNRMPTNNQKMLVNTEPVTFTVDCTNCAKLKPCTYSWSMQLLAGGVNADSFSSTTDEGTYTYEPVDFTSALGDSSATEQSLTIAKHFFKSGLVYKVTANVTCSQTTGSNSKYIPVNTPPKIGSCKISPLRGVTCKDKFDIECEGFSDVHKPLQYALYYFKDSDSSSRYILKSFQSSPTFNQTLLPLGDSTNGFLLKLQVVVSDSPYKSETVLTLSVAVSHHGLTFEDVDSCCNNVLSNEMPTCLVCSRSVMPYIPNVSNDQKKQITKRQVNLISNGPLPTDVSQIYLTTEALVDCSNDEDSLDGDSVDKVTDLGKKLFGDNFKNSAVSASMLDCVTKGAMSVAQNAASGASKCESETKCSQVSKEQSKNMRCIVGSVRNKVASQLAPCMKKSFETVGQILDCNTICKDVIPGFNLNILPSVCSEENSICMSCKTTYLKNAPFGGSDKPKNDIQDLELFRKREESDFPEKVEVKELPKENRVKLCIDSGNLKVEKIELNISSEANNIVETEVRSGVSLFFDVCLSNSELKLSQLVIAARFNGSEKFAFKAEIDLPVDDSPHEVDIFGWYNINCASSRCGASYDSCIVVFASATNLSFSSEILNIYIDGAFEDDVDPTLNEPQKSIIGVYLSGTGCKYYQEDEGEWVNTGVEVSALSTPEKVCCLSSHLSAFGGSVFIAPNSLNVVDSLKMLTSVHENPIVLITLLVVFGVYAFAAIWCRRRDKRDEKKLGITYLSDNNPNDLYEYEVTVYTGLGRDCGTTSNITAVIVGKSGASTAHVLFEDNKELFKSGSVDTFILTTPKSLGELQSLSLWHNNRGKSPSWYMKHVVVKDKQTNEQCIFLNNRWLAVDKDDGQIERDIPVSTDSELKDFSQLFRSKLERDLWDGHIWFSVFGRPVRSTFTRLQRASCCLCLLLCTMLANIMFFGVVESDTNTIEVAGMELSWTQVMVGLECNVVIFPVNFLLAYLFKNARPRLKTGENKESSSGRPVARRKKQRKIKDTTSLFSSTNSLSLSTSHFTVSHNSMSFASKPKPPKSLLGKILHKIKKLRKKEKYDEHELNQISTSSIESALYEPPPSRNKKSKGLPWWAVYIAWVILVLVAFFSSSFTLLYGLSYGKEKSLLWLKTFLMSFFQSLLFVQPIKITLIGLFFALLIKKPEAPDPKETERMVKINETADLGPSLVELSYSDYKIQYKHVQAAYRRPIKADVEAARIYREKQKRMWDAIFEIGKYLMFLFLLSTICNGQTDPAAFLMTNNVRNMFTDGTKFSQATTYTKAFDWLRISVIPGLYLGKWYNGNVTDNIDGFAADMQSFVVGAARIRQVRLNPEHQCKLPKAVRSVIQECNPEYDLGSGDVTGYLKKWVLPNETIDAYTYYDDIEEGGEGHIVGSNPWVYVPQLKADGIPVWGDHNVYGPGGYMLVLSKDMDESLERLQELKDNSWLDEQTRALLVEFTIYNSNVNLFSVVTLLIEFSAQGDGYPYQSVKTLRLYPYLTSVGYLILVCQIAYMAFVIYFMVGEVKELKRNKLQYFKQFWNWVEIIIISFSWTSFILLMSYLLGVERTMRQIKEHAGTKFISFAGPAAVNESYKVFCGLTCFFGYVKFLHMLRFNKKMASFAGVLRYAAFDILNFFIMFAVFFVAFAQLSNLILGTIVYAYKSFVTTSTTLMAMMLGQWEFEAVERANRVLGPGCLFGFVISANIVLINVFLSIICEACETVKNDCSKMENDFEVVDFMIDQLKMIIGSSSLGKSSVTGESSSENNENEKPGIDLNQVLCEFDSQMNFIDGHYCGDSDDSEDNVTINDEGFYE